MLRIALLAVDIVDKLVQQLDDPRAKQIGERAMNLIKPGIKEFIEAAREAVKNPDDRKW